MHSNGSTKHFNRLPAGFQFRVGDRIRKLDDPSYIVTVRRITDAGILEVDHPQRGKGFLDHDEVELVDTAARPQVDPTPEPVPEPPPQPELINAPESDSDLSPEHTARKPHQSASERGKARQWFADADYSKQHHVIIEKLGLELGAFLCWLINYDNMHPRRDGDEYFFLPIKVVAKRTKAPYSAQIRLLKQLRDYVAVRTSVTWGNHRYLRIDYERLFRECSVQPTI